MTIRNALLGTAALAVLASPALADDAAIEKRLDDMQRMIAAQQKQIEAQKGEIGQLRKALGKRGARAAPARSVGPTATAAAAPPALDQRMSAEEAKVNALEARMETESAQARDAR